MKPDLSAKTRVAITAICCSAIALVLGASRARADGMDKRTVITVKEPMQVTNRLLDPGTYVFVLLGGHSDRYTDRNTVAIYNGDQTRVIDTIVAAPAYRVQPLGKTTFTFWETPPGTARALRDWYYPGDNFGREFAYPKNPAVLTAELHTWAPPRAQESAAASAPQPAHAEAMTSPAPAPTEVAEAAPAPAPEPATEPVPTPEPAPVPNAAQAELPKTASPYPAVGLAGLLLLGVGGLLRRRRSM